MARAGLAAVLVVAVAAAAAGLGDRHACSWGERTKMTTRLVEKKRTK